MGGGFSEDVACAAQAARQQGVITREQALSKLTRRQIEGRLSSGIWVRLFPSVYRFAGAARSWRQSIEGLVLWAGCRCAISHGAAARLHGFESFAGAGLELTVPSHQRSPDEVRIHRVEGFHPKDLTRREGLPVTSVPRTLLDLATQLDAKTLESAIEEALQKKMTTLDDLRAVLERNEGRAGTALLRRLVDTLEGLGGPTESQLERAVLDVLEVAGIEAPTRQRRVSLSGRRCRVDFCFAQQRVVLEADGYRWHSSREAFEADRQRDNALMARGFRVLRWTWKAIHERPDELIAELCAVLAA